MSSMKLLCYYSELAILTKQLNIAISTGSYTICVVIPVIHVRCMILVPHVIFIANPTTQPHLLRYSVIVVCHMILL